MGCVTWAKKPIGGKWLEILKEIAPSITRVAVIMQAGHVAAAGIFRAMESRSSSYTTNPPPGLP
jgi:hypothetical protein